MQFLPTQKSPKIQSRSRLPIVEEDYSEENRVTCRMKLKMYNKISPNSRSRKGGRGERRRKREEEQMEEKKILP